MRRSILTIFTLLICLATANQSFAASYAVAPFKVNGSNGYAYLEKAIPPMFSSRLFLLGVNEPVATQDKLLSQAAIQNEASAQTARQKHNADFLIYGSITIIGENVSLDVNVVGKDKYWKKATQTNINNLFNGVQSISNDINREIFGRNINPSSQSMSTTPRNQSIIANEITPQATNYLNPELRYQGAETQRTRTKSLDYESYGFEIQDFNGDGFEEIAILNSEAIKLYRFENNQLTLLSTYKVASSLQPLRIRSLVRNDEIYLVFTAHIISTKDAESSILRFNGDQLQEVARTNYYLNVASTTSLEKPSLIGQRSDKTRFIRGAVYQMNFDGDSIKRGRSLSSLPKEANVFNFTWLPASHTSTDPDGGGDHLIVIDDSDKMVIFNSKGKRIAKSEEYYASTGVGVGITRDMTGFASKEGSTSLLNYYIPMRVVIADLDKNGQFEAITSKPVSTAAVLLSNYRTYSQSEIHAQIWDGIGMSLLWKTRRVKGTIVDVQIADPNNDGITDLVVNVNTYPGVAGVGRVRNVVVLYPLDTANVDTSAVNYSE